MSDTTSLLLRLEMEKQPLGVDLKERWQRVAQFYEDHLLNHVGSNFFFDSHLLMGLLFGRTDKTKVIEKVEAMMEKWAKEEDGWNARQFDFTGPYVIKGLKEFAAGNYVDSVDAFMPVRHRMVWDLTGSLAQLQIFELIMLRAAVLAGPERRAVADQLLNEQVARSYSKIKSNAISRIEQLLVVMQ